MLKSLFSLTVILLLAGCGLGIGPQKEQTDNHPLDLSGVTAVQLNAQDGDVIVVSTPTNAGGVTFTKRTPRLALGRGDCHSEYHMEGSTLVVNVTKDSLAQCDIDTQVTVPGAASLNLASDNGNLTVRDMSGPVTAKTKNGDVEIGLDQPAGDKPACTADFSSDNGNVTVTVGYAPASGKLSAATSNGDVTIRLLNSTVFALSESHDNGSLKDALTPNASAPFTVDLSSKDGDLKIESN